MKNKKLLAFGGVAALLLWGFSALAQQAPAAGATYTADGKIVKPADYRNWVHLSSSLGLQYSNGTGANRPPSFENVYVNPAAWREFEKTGNWPNGTTFVLEIRRALSKGSFAAGGQYQGEITATEMEVKDSRFADGWAWFDLPNGVKEGKQFGKDAGCLECHTANTAVEKTFTQFYPSAMDIAKEKKTVNDSYLKQAASGAFEK